MSVIEYNKLTNRAYSELDCHFHSIYEIYYFVSGDAEIMIEGNTYKLLPHTLILLTPGVMHGIQVNSDADYVRHVLYVEPTEVLPERLHLLRELFPDMKHYSKEAAIYENTQEYHLGDFFYNIHKIQSLPSPEREELDVIFTEALVAQLHLLVKNLKPTEQQISTNDKITEIVSYINNHLTEPLTLDSIAGQFYMSKNYLNRIFKQALGTTAIEFIRYKRVTLAKNMIVQDGESATNAALRVGFTDYSSFFRTYQKYLHRSPRDDMQKRAQWST